jgi:hypothetical protein
MKTIAALSLLLFTLAPVQSAANLTGKWTGSFTLVRPDGTENKMTIELNLTHKGKDLTGTAGPGADRQWPLTNGVVEGTKATFQVQEHGDGPVISFRLDLTNDRLVGEASGEDDGQKLAAKVDAGRAGGVPALTPSAR